MNQNQVQCPFCAIAGGHASTELRLESEFFICFAPLKSEVPGHTIIASRKHYRSLMDAPPHIGGDLIAVCQALADFFRASGNYSGFNLLNANEVVAQQSVMHLHFHYLPRCTDDGINAWPNFENAQKGAFKPDSV